MSALKSWLVPYRATFEGTAVVEADSAEAAEALVEAGDFTQDPATHEMVDWSKRGEAKENA